LNRQKHSPKPRSCQKLDKIIFPNFALECEKKQAFAKTKIVPKAEKINFSMLVLARTGMPEACVGGF